MRNIADGASYTTSSRYNHSDNLPFEGEPTPGLKFHTDLEPNPWLLMDFAAAYQLREIVIYNRFDVCQDRAETIKVEASTDGSSFDTLYQAERTIFDGVTGTTPLRVSVDTSTAYRFMRLSLQEENYLHLDFVQVFAAPFWKQSVPADGGGLTDEAPNQPAADWIEHLAADEQPAPVDHPDPVVHQEPGVQAARPRPLAPLPAPAVYTPPSPRPRSWRNTGLIVVAVAIIVAAIAWLRS